MVISDGNTTEEYSDMKLINCRIEDGLTWFILAEKTDAEKQAEAIMAKLSQNASDVQDCMMAMAEMFEAMAAMNA